MVTIVGEMKSSKIPERVVGRLGEFPASTAQMPPRRAMANPTNAAMTTAATMAMKDKGRLGMEEENLDQRVAATDDGRERDDDYGVAPRRLAKEKTESFLTLPLRPFVTIAWGLVRRPIKSTIPVRFDSP